MSLAKLCCFTVNTCLGRAQQLGQGSILHWPDSFCVAFDKLSAAVGCLIKSS